MERKKYFDSKNKKDLLKSFTITKKNIFRYVDMLKFFERKGNLYSAEKVNI